MRDTLLLVLACIGGTSVMLTGVVLLWVGGHACIDWHDRVLTKRDVDARAERAAQKWGSYVSILARGRRSYASVRAEGWASYSTVDELIAESGRRAGARGESDG